MFAINPEPNTRFDDSLAYTYRYNQCNQTNLNKVSKSRIYFRTECNSFGGNGRNISSPKIDCELEKC